MTTIYMYENTNKAFIFKILNKKKNSMYSFREREKDSVFLRAE